MGNRQNLQLCTNYFIENNYVIFDYDDRTYKTISQISKDIKDTKLYIKCNKKKIILNEKKSHSVVENEIFLIVDSKSFLCKKIYYYLENPNLNEFEKYMKDLENKSADLIKYSPIFGNN